MVKSTTMNIWIINGPNLNLTGKRQPSIYGNQSFDDFMDGLRIKYPHIAFHYYQSNIEGELISAIQEAGKAADAIILNAGGYTHTSVGIADAVQAVYCPVIEVHLSNLFSREDFRHRSYIAPYARGVILGFGMDSYRLAIESLIGE